MALIARTGGEKIDWVGTSMGGVIGMLLAAEANTPIRRLVINDIGPFIPLIALKRIGAYVGQNPAFDSVDEVEEYMREIYAVLDQDYLVDHTQHQPYREHPRRLSDTIHPERVDSVRCGPSDGHYFSDLRRIWRAASSQFALTSRGDVSLYQRLHRESCRHRSGK
jgi:pimeloyl-ACP methyl ester carboxylesterase